MSDKDWGRRRLYRIALAKQQGLPTETTKEDLEAAAALVDAGDQLNGIYQEYLDRIGNTAVNRMTFAAMLAKLAIRNAASDTEATGHMIDALKRIIEKELEDV